MKSFLARVYNSDGEPIAVWDTAKFSSFDKSINGGLGECVLDLAVTFDYSGPELLEGNNVELFVNGIVVYSGYISTIVPWATGQREGIKVHLLGYHTKLFSDILKNGSQTTLYTHDTDGLTITGADIAPADTGLIVKAILNRYVAETNNPGIIVGEIKETGEDMEYLFEMMDYRSALDKVLSASPSNYYWYVDENRIFTYKDYSDSPMHNFILGKHFVDITVKRNSEKIRNAMLFWNGEPAGSSDKIFKLYENEASVKQYGRRVEKHFDWAVGDATTADHIAKRFLELAKDVDIEVQCDIINDSSDIIGGYNIESIQPGDTCMFTGFNENLADIFRENMLITNVNYSLDRVRLTIRVRRAGLIDWQNELSRKATENYSRNAPETYSV